MSRLPIRVRLTLLFALAMAVVLAAVGAFVYVRLGSSLEEQLDDALEARVQGLATITDFGGSPFASADDDDVGQLIGPDGSVIAGSSDLDSALLLTPEELTRARGGAFFTTRESVPGLKSGESARLLVSPLDRDGSRSVLVVGASLGDRDEALDGLLAQLLIGGPIALLLASGAAYLLAGAALRPVEAMRVRADEISAETSGRRLPLPETRDEICRLGETLNAMLERLDEGLRRERRFVADAGHELRTPLALLQTELELALRRPRTPEEHEAALRSASEEVDRLTRLAEDLLVLASTEDGELPIRRSEFSARELLDGVARRFATRAAADGRNLETDAPDGVTLRADRPRLEQALGNLVDNALRHGAGRVRLDAAQNSSGLVLRVGDEGAGFPAEFLPHAFERFSRADDARPRGGAGLGLAIVDTVARAHGGRVDAANGPDGTVVRILLPRA